MILNDNISICIAPFMQAGSYKCINNKDKIKQIWTA